MIIDGKGKLVDERREKERRQKNKLSTGKKVEEKRKGERRNSK